MARAKNAAAPPGPAMTAQERVELDARLAAMFSKPVRSERANGRFFLLWVARDTSGAPQTMIWNPETEQELRDANLFYDAAHGFGAFAKPVPKGKPVPRTAEHAALIAGVLANRADATGYLVYADYLTEQGDSQGDYIRLCVERAKLPPGHPDADALAQRTTELSDAHAEEWFAPLGELGLRPETSGYFVPFAWMSFERGVIEEVTIDRPGVLPENAARLFAAAPFLRALRFEQGHLDPAGLAKVKQLAQIEELDLFHTELTTEGLRALLRSKHLTGLKSLELRSNPIGDVGAVVLTQWPGLAHLEALDVSSCGMSAVGAHALGAWRGVANLKKLRIGGNGNDSGTVSAVLSSIHLGNLTDLELGGYAFDIVAAPLVGTAAFAGTLEVLDLDSATFEPGAFAAFVGTKLPVLRVLKLNGVNLPVPAATELASAAFRDSLEELYLDNCALGAGSGNFFYQGRFPKLRTLDVSRNRIERYGLSVLAAKPKNFPALQSLKLWDNRLGAEAVATLAASKVLANLTELDLSGNKIGPAGAVALAQSKYLKKLASLTVDERAVGKKGKQALLDRFGDGVVSFR